MTSRIDLKDLSLPELEALVIEYGEKPYRARQIAHWLYQKGVDTFADMTNLPQTFRERLAQNCRIGRLEMVERQRASDGTEKFLYRLVDGGYIESVLIREPRRRTLCISTQVGCRMGCRFCRTA
ncbi:MAG: 23S rRNA (adenine(2503)-C(2))-methyltransferase RlmN, partial [Nitrospinota bacterium]